jgi:erythromycin esterase-like protein
VDPAAAGRARHRYACFDHAGEDPQAYGYAAAFELGRSCEDAAVEQLVELRRRACQYARRDGREGEDEAFSAAQNALVVKDAEGYYRQMFGGRVNTWNLRDRHMTGTVEALASYLDRRVGRAKVIVWAHNSHLGDARATEVSEAGELNVGQLLREAHPGETLSVGFSTYSGTVTAADDWDEPARRMRVRPAMRDSYECVFHDVGFDRFLLNLREVAAEGSDLAEQLGEDRLQRAIGVIYRPQTERVSHYLGARLIEQFDAMIHVEETRAVEPLERLGRVDDEVPETFPAGV